MTFRIVPIPRSPLLEHIPAFCDHFAVALRATLEHPDGIWTPEPHQTPEQAQAWNELIDGGAGQWQPAGVAGTGVIADSQKKKRSAK